MQKKLSRGWEIKIFQFNRNNYKSQILLLLILFVSNSLSAQYSRFSKEIDRYDNILESIKKTDYLTTDELILLSKKIEVREEFVSTLQSEVKQFNKKINSLESSIKRIEADLEIAKEQYAELLVFTYLSRTESSFFMFILSAQSFNQAYLRFKYLKIITTYTKRQAEFILFYKKELEYQKEILQKEKNIREIFDKSYQNQKNLLTVDIRTQLIYIQKLQQKSDTLRKQLDIYNAWQKELNLSIKTEITIKIQSPENDDEMTAKFEENKGKMPMPLYETIVISAYGEHKHPTLDKIKIKNDGIDITSHSDDKAKAVFEGTVIRIVEIPGHNSSVLIKHGDYFTVYSSLVDIQVVENQKVIEGNILGQVSKAENQKYPVLNFQVWHLADKKDPITWVKR